MNNKYLTVSAINRYLKGFDAKIVFTTNQYVNSIKESMKNTDVQKMVVISPADELRKCNQLSEPSKEYLTKVDVKYDKADNVIGIADFEKIGNEHTGKIEKCDFGTYGA